MQATDEQAVISDRISRYLKNIHPGGATLNVVPQGIRHEEDWWYVPVKPDRQPEKRYEYYEALARVEAELARIEQLTILFLPTAPDEFQEE